MTLRRQIPLASPFLLRPVTVAALAWSACVSTASPSFAAEDGVVVINRVPIIVAGTTGESFRSGGGTARPPLQIGQKVHVGGHIITESNSFAELLFQRTALLVIRRGADGRTPARPVLACVCTLELKTSCVDERRARRSVHVGNALSYGRLPTRYANLKGRMLT